MKKGPAPQLAQPLKGEPLVDAVFEPKYDGIRVIVHKVGSDLAIYTRTFHDQTGKLPHLEAAFRSVPFDFTLDGEVIEVADTPIIEGQEVPIGRFSGAQSVMGSGVTRAAKSNIKLNFVVFDCLAAKGMDLKGIPDAQRRGAAELMVELLRTETEYILITPRWTEVDDYRELMAQVVEAGGEGLMVKNPRAKYRAGQRPSNTWLKLKDTETADVVVVGYKPGTNGFKGLVGAVVFGQYKNGGLVERSRCSGMNMDMRREFTENGEAYIGKVMEIKYFGRVGPERSFRHPNFVSIRDDKAPEECEWDE